MRLDHWSISQQYSLQGRVIEENRKPLEYVFIYLLKNDNTISGSTYTDSLGNFKLQAELGNYKFLIELFGEKVFEQNVQINQNILLGEIKIVKSKLLNELTITTEKKLIEQKIDRLVLNIENSISSTGGDGLDAIKATLLLL